MGVITERFSKTGARIGPILVMMGNKSVRWSLFVFMVVGLLFGGCSVKGAAEPGKSTKEGKGRYELQDEYRVVLFGFDSARLRPGTNDVVNFAVKRLGANASVKLVLEGHADERGTNAYNLALGHRRANAVKRALLAAGVAAKRVRTVSFGEERPISTGSSESAFRKNRRVEFTEE